MSKKFQYVTQAVTNYYRFPVEYSQIPLGLNDLKVMGINEVEQDKLDHPENYYLPLYHRRRVETVEISDIEQDKDKTVSRVYSAEVEQMFLELVDRIEEEAQQQGIHPSNQDIKETLQKLVIQFDQDKQVPEVIAISEDEVLFTRNIDSISIAEESEESIVLLMTSYDNYFLEGYQATNFLRHFPRSYFLGTPKLLKLYDLG